MLHAPASEKPGGALLQGLSGPSGFLFVLAFLLTFALANMEAVLALYGQKLFSMGPMQVGLLMGAMGILAVIQQGAVIGPLTRKIGEPRVIQVGLVVGILGFAGLALAPTLVWYGIAAIVFNAGSALLQPSVTSLISKRAVAGQGATMGLNQSFQSLGRATGPLWAGFAFDRYVAAVVLDRRVDPAHRAAGVAADAAAPGAGGRATGGPPVTGTMIWVRPPAPARRSRTRLLTTASVCGAQSTAAYLKAPSARVPARPSASR